ncbi:metal-binding protein [Novosphingobium sp. FSW06-99]|nr:metal-binding protein [Novosphingobium sp. FSW06-99]
MAMAEPASAGTTFSSLAEPCADAGNRAIGPVAKTNAHWDSLGTLSSVQRTIEQFLNAHPFERAPWLVVGYGTGIGAWIALSGPWQWAAWISLCAAAMVIAPLIAREGQADHLRHALIGMALMLAAGCAAIWMKSALVGAPPIAMRETVVLAGRIVDRQDASGGARLLLAARIAGVDRPVLVQVMIPAQIDRGDLVPGATIAASARLDPPAPPMLPGSHDYAFAAWFAGIAATGSIGGPVTVIARAAPAPSMRWVAAGLRDHVLAHLGGSAGAIAATLASGDRGAIGRSDAEAMRDAGFAHLLSISGLHVSAVIAAVYLLVFRGLGLVPWIALRVRLPLLAAMCGAGAGVAYCLITGSQVPTMRAVAGAVLVLGALALGRDPLSMRLLAVAALFVMLFWPEAVAGPGFQMSFGAVIAVIALHGAAPMQRFMTRREEGPLARLGRQVVLLVVGGLAIECALLPMALFHFHRAGLYGALANLVAIPLVVCVAMPGLALALLLDPLGLGGPAWWVTGRALDAVLWVAHATASLPGAVTTLPAMPGWVYGLWIAGGLWLALWSGPVRRWGLVPMVLALCVWVMIRPPDILIAGDGRHVGITGLGPDLVVLSPGQGHFARDQVLEASGMAGATRPLEDWPGAQCTHDFCALALTRYGRRTVLMIAQSHRRLNEDGLAQACAQSDLVIADHPLPAVCHPRQLLADGTLLARTGGMTIDLASGTIRTVAQTSGDHVWHHWP